MRPHRETQRPGTPEEFWRKGPGWRFRLSESGGSFPLGHRNGRFDKRLQSRQQGSHGNPRYGEGDRWFCSIPVYGSPSKANEIPRGAWLLLEAGPRINYGRSRRRPL